MASSKTKTSALYWAAGAVLIVAAGFWWFGVSSSDGALVDVTLPELSRTAQAGQKAFAENCAPCHGKFAGGTDQGPPLIHRIYRPAHHADAAFQLAAQRGVSQHHWNFGDMPPQPQVGDRAILQIIEFIRELQVANGI